MKWEINTASPVKNIWACSFWARNRAVRYNLCLSESAKDFRSHRSRGHFADQKNCGAE